MKKIPGAITAGLLIAIFMCSCNDASKKDMGDASKNIKEANADVKEAVIDANDTAKANTIAAWKVFKNESDTAIAVMERQVVVLEGKIAKANTKEKEKLNTDLNKTKEKLHELKEKLQQRNAAFENDINKFDATVVSKNESFEREFKHDMDELGTAIKDLFKDNVK
ncbi:MAG TPA: hypothetical protein PLP23_17920 [Panacibacter sp.]|nr:hypothetical protein [Panacibacter sp.]